jgi:hydroxymethylpyrimidine pyrophosphatase-like HAD family hydrolase
MEEKILLGRGQKIIEIPQATWKQHLTQIPQHSQSRLNFMTDNHHQIRYFVVKELANRQKPIEPEFISEKLNVPLELVKSILEELERKLFFLVRNEQGAVTWAYPVTVEITPHKINFSSGECLYAA